MSDDKAITPPEPKPPSLTTPANKRKTPEISTVPLSTDESKRVTEHENTPNESPKV